MWQDANLPTPENIITLLDRVRVKTSRLLTSDEKEMLTRFCGKKVRGGRRTFAFRPPIIKYSLYQPTDEALKIIYELDKNGRVSQLEIALDWIMANQADVEHAMRYLDGHSVKLWHNGTVVNFKGKNGHVTRYSDQRKTKARRTTRNNMVNYGDKPCKVTGEYHCCHIEWRVGTQEALQQLGIRTTANLLNFDYRGFWRKRLILADVNTGKLGRRMRKEAYPKIRKRKWLVGYGKHRIDGDRRAGQVAIRASERVQDLVDRWGTGFLIRRNVDDLLPGCGTLHAHARGDYTPQNPSSENSALLEMR